MLTIILILSTAANIIMAVAVNAFKFKLSESYAEVDKLKVDVSNLNEATESIRKMEIASAFKKGDIAFALKDNSVIKGIICGLFMYKSLLNENKVNITYHIRTESGEFLSTEKAFNTKEELISSLNTD